MECYVCKQFRYSKWRSTPDPNSESRSKVKTRHCAIKGKYINGSDETCDKCEPDLHFHCNRYNYQLSTKECITRHGNKLFKKCKRCGQYNDVVEQHKAVVFYERKQKALEGKPVLVRRKVVTNGEEK